MTFDLRGATVIVRVPTQRGGSRVVARVTLPPKIARDAWTAAMSRAPGEPIPPAVRYAARHLARHFA